MKYLRTVMILLALIAIACGGSDGSEEPPAEQAARATVEDTATPPPSETPEPTETLTSTPTATATETPSPTSTPTETPTRRPTATRLPTSTPRPTATATPVPEPVTYTGTGDDVVEVDWPAGTSAVMMLTNSGGGHFAVWTLDGQGENIDLKANTSGVYSGTRPFNFFEEPAFIEVTSSGSWSITIVPLVSLDWVTTFPHNGDGDDVIILQSSLRSGRTTITHQGRGHFAIWGFDPDGRRDLVVNESGNYSGTVFFQDFWLLDITADGPWTLEKAD